MPLLTSVLAYIMASWPPLSHNKTNGILVLQINYIYWYGLMPLLSGISGIRPTLVTSYVATHASTIVHVHM